MSKQALEWFEFAFNLLYLIVIFGTAGAMAYRLPRVAPRERPMAVRLLAAFTLLGTGDLGHIGLRILAQLQLGDFAAWVGWGGLTTAITITVFYVLLLDAWRVHFARPMGWFEWLLVATAAIRLLLLIPAGNQWQQLTPPLEWSLIRNAPLVVLGVGVMALYLRDGRLPGQRPLFTIGVLIAVSFACYAPVILLVQRYPLVGLLMIPKTVAYLAMGVVAYLGYFRPRKG